jgi:hypothetical protein
MMDNSTTIQYYHRTTTWFFHTIMAQEITLWNFLVASIIGILMIPWYKTVNVRVKDRKLVS